VRSHTVLRREGSGKAAQVETHIRIHLSNKCVPVGAGRPHLGSEAPLNLRTSPPPRVLSEVEEGARAYAVNLDVQ